MNKYSEAAGAVATLDSNADALVAGSASVIDVTDVPASNDKGFNETSAESHGVTHVSEPDSSSLREQLLNPAGHPNSSSKGHSNSPTLIGL